MVGEVSLKLSPPIPSTCLSTNRCNPSSQKGLPIKLKMYGIIDYPLFLTKISYFPDSVNFMVNLLIIYMLKVRVSGILLKHLYHKTLHSISVIISTCLMDQRSM